MGFADSKIATGTGTASILSLPSEIRGHIFNLLGTKDATNLRRVCQQFKNDVDTYVDFAAELDETKGNENGWFLKRILALRLKEVTVRQLMGPPCIFGHFGTQLLQQPNLLRKIVLPANAKMAPENFHYLLQDSGDALQILELSIVPPLSLSSAPPELELTPENFQYRVGKVKSLSLNLSTIPTQAEDVGEFVELQVMQGPPMKLKETSIPILLLSSPFKELRSLKIVMRCLGFRQVSQLSALVFRIVSQSSKTLQELDFDLIQGHGVPSLEEKPLSEYDMEKLDLGMLRKVTNLRAVRVVNSTAIGISLWAQLLSQQTNLVALESDILPAPAALFRQIICNNLASLVDVDIGDLTLDAHEETGALVPFDLEVFRDCTGLRKLTLDRNSLTRRRANELSQELINLPALPESLMELNLNYFLILSEDLFTYFTSSVSFNLTSLSLSQCGDSEEFGVQGSVLQKIISLPVIHFIEISPLNFRVSWEEQQKLNLILTAFGYPEKHSYFQLERVTPYPSEDRIGMDDISDSED